MLLHSSHKSNIAVKQQLIHRKYYLAAMYPEQPRLPISGMECCTYLAQLAAVRPAFA